MAATWTVTGDIPDQYSSTGTGTPVLGHVIQFITGNQNRGTIFVTNDQYTAASVKKAVQLQADTVDEINSLKG